MRQLKNSLRVLLSKKNYLLINVTGLGVGIASFLILALYIYNDLTYNRFNKNIDNIYRIKERDYFVTHGLLVPKMLEEIPEVENATRIFTWDGYRLSYNDKAFPQGVQYADTGFFSIFTFPFIEGSSGVGIHEKYGVVISSDLAKKFFGDEKALGKKLQVKFEDKFLQVNGVVDIPDNSSIKFDIIGSYETGIDISPWIKDVHDWYNVFSTSYVMLKNGTDPETIHDKMQKIVHENFVPAGQSTAVLGLLPFREYHSSQETNKTLIIILTIVALSIIGIAVVNFINLSVTSFLSRIREAGIKKVIGATEGMLFRQTMTESLIVSFIAMLAGIELASLGLPYFNRIFNTRLEFMSGQLVFIFCLLTSIWLTVGIISGLIPSIFLSKTKLIQALHGNILTGQKRSSSRNSLVVVQFAIAIVLISGTILVRKQIAYMINKDPKFDKENVIVAELNSWQYPDLNAASDKFRYIYNELKASPFVKSACFSQTIPGIYQENYNTFSPEGSDEGSTFRVRKSYVGRDYFKTYGINIISGSGFDEDGKTYNNCMLLNEAAMKKSGLTAAADQVIHESGANGPVWRLIGINEDFSYQGAQKEIEPLAHFFEEHENLASWGYMSVRANPGSTLKVIEMLKDLWGKTEPVSSVTYYPAIDKLNEQYKDYIQINSIVAWFSVIAILLSCMGLFALSSYAITRRTKEIGIRKINGAKIPEVIFMLNKDFIKWVSIAFAASIPVSWFVIHKWLESFANKTQVSWWTFALAGIVAFVIALFTVSWQSWRAATRDPVKALRYE
ncbi:MAG TPA: FtsX-like permease family protein [Bacteroidales bacterium]|nr:FtsX-like permease family protein [Bacteroidales bacterium]